jgi:hypothetical protein
MKRKEKIFQNKDLKLVRNELTKYGISDYVGVSIYKMRDDRGKAVPHMVAQWNEVRCYVDDYMYEVNTKAEKIDRYFNAELFVKGITQRAAWIKADFEDKVEYLKENQYGHPALFPVWLESKKTA